MNTSRSRSPIHMRIHTTAADVSSKIHTRNILINHLKASSSRVACASAQLQLRTRWLELYTLKNLKVFISLFVVCLQYESCSHGGAAAAVHPAACGMTILDAFSPSRLRC